MRNQALMYFFAVLMVVVTVTGLASRPSEVESSMKTVASSSIAAGIALNNTDYNITFAETTYPGPKTISPRITFDYPDLVARYNLELSVANLTVLPRLVIEYADAVNRLNLESVQGPTVAARIRVEYGDLATTSFDFRYAYDINDDHKVDMRDVGTAARLYGSSSGSDHWNMIADINGDTKIDMKDIGAIARHYGERYT